MRSLLSLLVILLFGAGEASAQRHAFEGIAWGTEDAEVRAALQARGFTFRTVEDGDPRFIRADSAFLRAEMSGGRLVGFTLVDPARGPAVAERYAALNDSLRAALGPPDETVPDHQEQRWVAGLTCVHLRIARVAGERHLQMYWHGPGWYDEMDRRASNPLPPPGFTTVSTSAFARMAIDTTVRQARGATAVRGRFRIQYWQAITPQIGGVDQPPLDVAEYEMDFDCAGRRARLIARATYLDGRRQGSHQSERPAWTVPQPDSHYARGLAAICRAARN
jgi:hypothetical protein